MPMEDDNSAVMSYFHLSTTLEEEAGSSPVSNRDSILRPMDEKGLAQGRDATTELRHKAG